MASPWVRFSLGMRPEGRTESGSARKWASAAGLENFARRSGSGTLPGIGGPSRGWWQAAQPTRLKSSFAFVAGPPQGSSGFERRSERRKWLRASISAGVRVGCGIVAPGLSFCGSAMKSRTHS